jgi:hypothetical protein
VDAADLHRFLTEDSDRRAFLSKKTEGLSSVRVPIADERTDLRELVADRIYDIRCRIVHTKETPDQEVEVLLPFSKEADLLTDDIELVAFIARACLASASRQLDLRPWSRPER